MNHRRDAYRIEVEFDRFQVYHRHIGIEYCRIVHDSKFHSFSYSSGGVCRGHPRAVDVCETTSLQNKFRQLFQGAPRFLCIVSIIHHR